MILNYLKLFRIPQWIKNVFVFVPLVFSKHLFELNYTVPAIKGFFAFCMVSSIVYVINDIVDVKEDRVHPKKRNRPIASGKISIPNALISAVFLLMVGVAISFNLYNKYFALTVLAYFILNYFYSTIFKHIVLLDVFSIAAGFMLRVLAGAFVIQVPVSSWLILTTMFLSLFLGIMKRHSELEMISQSSDSQVTRKVLQEYSQTFTQQMATIAAAAVIICYALYTVSEKTIKSFGTENLIYTTPFIVFGIFRYMYLVFMNQKGENTTEIMLTDIPMIVNIFIYIAVTTIILYKTIF